MTDANMSMGHFFRDGVNVYLNVFGSLMLNLITREVYNTKVITTYRGSFVNSDNVTLGVDFATNKIQTPYWPHCSIRIHY